MATEIARIGDFSREVSVFLSPSSRQKEIAAYAVAALVAAQIINRKELGRFPPYEVTVDGRKDAALTSVDPVHGVIEFEFQFLDPAVLRWISDQLRVHSPRLTGRYQSSHVLLADGVPVNLSGSTPSARQYIFVNAQPYSRKIERAQEVYQIVAALAAKQFPDVKIRFGFAPAQSSWVGIAAPPPPPPTRGRNRRRGIDWLIRQPAIIITDR